MCFDGTFTGWKQEGRKRDFKRKYKKYIYIYIFNVKHQTASVHSEMT